MSLLIKHAHHLMRRRNMKISENTEIKIDLKTVIGMYYKLQEDIALAKTLPPVEVTRLEYELKEEWNEDMIMQLKDEVDMISETIDILKEEISITASMIKDGTKADNRLDELNDQLEALKNKKPSTRVIVKEVKV